LLASGVGFALLSRSRHSAGAFVLPALLFLAFDIYIIASWWDWQFGGSFGHRGFVDTLPIFAIGLAAFFESIWNKQTLREAVIAIVVLAIALNLFQMLQYWNHVLPVSDTTWDQYRRVFLRWQ
jgi:hypothetical protein